jgi:hypothetical protein
MYRVLMSWAVLSFLSFSLSANAQTVESSTAPTEVGTTTMTPGEYSVTDQGNGKKYSLMVTTKGTMILGPATTTVAPTTTTTTTKTTSGLEGLAQSQMKKGMTTLIEKQGMSEIKGLVK